MTVKIEPIKPGVVTGGKEQPADKPEEGHDQPSKTEMVVYGSLAAILFGLIAWLLP
jgi:hypothetical protein